MEPQRVGKQTTSNAREKKSSLRKKYAIIVHYLALQYTTDLFIMQMTVLDVSMTRLYWDDG